MMQCAPSAQSDKINSSDAFEIYGRAALLGDQILCDHFIGKAAKKSLAAGDTRVASQIPTASLINYVRNIWHSPGLLKKPY